jgi:hypothetical protein
VTSEVNARLAEGCESLGVVALDEYAVAWIS